LTGVEWTVLTGVTVVVLVMELLDLLMAAGEGIRLEN
jgi:hypothetical protein